MVERQFCPEKEMFAGEQRGVVFKIFKEANLKSNIKN